MVEPTQALASPLVSWTIRMPHTHQASRLKAMGEARCEPQWDPIDFHPVPRGTDPLFRNSDFRTSGKHMINRPDPGLQISRGDRDLQEAKSH